MPSAEPEPASNVTERRQPVKKKRRIESNTPNVYSRRSPPRERKASPAPARSDDEGERSPPRQLKRPGAGARIGLANREAAEAAKRKREEEERKAVGERQTNAAELVAAHYNAVPERGREWRKTDSSIKGLRSLNNWIKSTLIQKFSRPDIPVPQLLVLDIACGKGGDLGKWEKAPQKPALYVGCDIAETSIQQARDRYDENVRRSRGKHRGPEPPMDARFFVQDTYGRSLSEIPIIREVGFNPNAGPGSGVIQPGMRSGGFDVVSIMFSLHYSYESEELARGMLKNVSGALKKGGRFIGVMPNSDVISATVKRLLQNDTTGTSPTRKPKAASPKDGEEEGEFEEEDDWDPEKPTEPKTTNPANDEDDDDWDPTKPSDPSLAATNGTTNKADDDDEDDWDPTKPSEPPTNTSTTPPPATSDPTTSFLPPLEWGNTLYTVRFPRHQPLTKKPLPADGIFRPPYGWRYHYQLEEAVDVPEYVVPWESFRALAEDYGLELLYRKSFGSVLEDEKGDRELGQLAVRMGVVSAGGERGVGGERVGRGEVLVSGEEMEAAEFYHAFVFYKV